MGRAVNATDLPCKVFASSAAGSDGSCMCRGPTERQRQQHCAHQESHCTFCSRITLTSSAAHSSASATDSENASRYPLIQRSDLRLPHQSVRYTPSLGPTCRALAEPLSIELHRRTTMIVCKEYFAASSATRSCTANTKRSCTALTATVGRSLFGIVAPSLCACVTKSSSGLTISGVPFRFVSEGGDTISTGAVRFQGRPFQMTVRVASPACSEQDSSSR